MASTTTLARPYARAVFELARDRNVLAQWEDSLNFAATVMLDAEMAMLVEHPKVSTEQAAAAINDIGEAKFDDVFKDFIKLLAANRRLLLLPEILAIYHHLKAEAEKTMEVEVVSAIPLSDAQSDKLIASLKQRLGREITLNCKVDDAVLGGAIIRAGDTVIDGSVKSKLNSMSTALVQ